MCGRQQGSVKPTAGSRVAVSREQNIGLVICCVLAVLSEIIGVYVTNGVVYVTNDIIYVTSDCRGCKEIFVTLHPC